MRKIPKIVGFEFEIACNLGTRTILRKFNEATGWKAKSSHDPSISCNHMKNTVEIKTPPTPFGQAMTKLKKAFKFFQDNEVVTNSTTGLHINMSFAKQSRNYQIDGFKLQVIMDDLKWLKKFNREDISYCVSPKVTIGEKLGKIKKNKWNVDKFILSMWEELEEDCDGELADKYHAINIGHLFDNKPYVEYRALGGRNYHTRLKDVERACQEISKALDMSIDSRYDYLLKRYLNNMIGFDTKVTNNFIPH